MKFRLNKSEAQLLVNQLDMVLQGMSDAFERMQEDPTTFNTVEEFMETMGQAIEDRDTIQDIREKVNNGIQRGEARRSGRTLRPLRQRVPRHAG